MKKLSKKHIHYAGTLKPAAKPRILIIDDDIGMLVQLYAQRKILFKECSPVFALFGKPSDMDVIPVRKFRQKESAPPIVELSSLDEAVSFIAKKNNRIDGVLTGLWYKEKNKLSGTARDLLRKGFQDEFGMTHIDDDAVFKEIYNLSSEDFEAIHQAENEGIPYGFDIARAARYFVPVAIQASAHWDNRWRRHEQTARENGALGLFDRRHIDMDDPSYSGLAALKAEIEARRGSSKSWAQGS